MTIYLLLTYFCWNCLVFICYAYDKWQAKRGGWRVPEKVLLRQAVFLGGPGALLAIFFLHHKSSSQKSYFRWAALAGCVTSLLVAYAYSCFYPL
ncbi:DUF1294 domain-containing protein [Streptococcus sp. DD12]|uniref:DUF1294 domain-containing protein n=1 Tax=Streptococcus sp. DD12 TaxID=1777880 RepID=UPI0009E9050A|nr:DUF1294 domain-containing protein [Streptococcus sp. DD12]